MTRRPFTYGSVCSGIESASVAFAPIGWRCAFMSEIAPHPRRVLKHHFPEVPLRGDFTEIKAGEHDPIDLLIGGTPCQDFSIAGKRLGLDGERGNLTLEFGRLAGRLRPRWLAWENVPGVLSSNEGRDFAAVLGLFSGRSVPVPRGGWQNAGIIPGYRNAYGLAYRVLDAQFVRVDGFARAVPQRRRRVFVVGYLGDWRRAAAVLFERDCLSGHPAPRREAGSRSAAGTLGGTSPGGGWRFGADEAAAGQLIAGTLGTRSAAHPSEVKSEADFIVPVAFGGNDTRGPIQVSTALNAHGGPCGRMDFESETFVAQIAPAISASNLYGDHESREGLLVAHTLRGEGFDASEDGTGRGTPIVPICFDTTQITHPENRSNPQPGDPCHPLAAQGHPPAIAFSCKDHGADATDEGVTPTLRAMNFDKSHANAGGQMAVASPGIGHNGGPAWAVRRLTPLECERLQGFPDGWTAIPRMADGPRYQMLGNSKAVNVVRWLGRRIEAVEAIQEP